MAEAAPEQQDSSRRGRVGRGWAWLGLPAGIVLALLLAGRIGPMDAGGVLVSMVVAWTLAIRRSRWKDSSAGPPARMGEDQVSGVQAFAEALSEPCILIDRRTFIVYANPAASALFPLAQPASPLVMAVRHPRLLAALGEAAASGEERQVEIHQPVPADTSHLVTIVPLATRQSTWLDDESRLLVLIFRSLTEQKRLETLRSDFIANASHELRTPLTSLLGFIETLLGPASGDPDAQKRFLPIMRSQAQRMSRLIDDLLSLNRIEMRQHLRPTGQVDLNPLLREVRDSLSQQARDAGVQIELRLPGGETFVKGDASELFQVFENLLENGIKYGGSGGRVEVEVAQVSAPDGFRVSVVDHGEGIAAEHVPRLTERFYRVDADSSRKKKGTGLGLAIVKHIVQRHRGALSISSVPGQGTRIEVLLLA